MKIIKNKVFILLIFCFASVSSSQTRATITGKILDQKTGEPLPGVNLTLVGTVLGTSSDLNGQFLLQAPPGQYKLQVTMIGYKKVIKNLDLKSGEQVKMNISLQETVLTTPEIQITANKRRTSIQDSPISIGVITRRDFEQKNEIYIDELLKHSSGVHFMSSQINIRGSSGFNYGAGSRVLFLIDGVPVMPGDSGDIKWDLVPANQIERIEIIKGAGSALYGANALGGVVNVITKESIERPVTNIRLSAGVYDQPAYTEWRWTDRILHFDDIDIDHTRKLGQYTNLFVAAGRHQGTGYSQNGHYQRMNATAKLETKPTPQSKLTLFTSYEGGERGALLMWKSQHDALKVNPAAVGDYVKSNKFSLNAFHQWATSKNFALKTRTSYFRNYWKNFFHDNISASTANRYGLEIQGTYQLSEDHAIIFGTEESWDHVSSDLVGQHDQYVLSAFIQNEQTLFPNFNLSAGIRFDYHTVDTGVDDFETSPKLGIVWHIHPALSLRTSSGKGFRAASMSERFADSIYSGLRLVPNENLKSETAWSHEIGLNIRPHPNVFLDIAGFRNDYWDLIEPEPDENQIVQFINVTRARITGIETNLKFNFFKNIFTGEIGYTAMNPRDIEMNTVLGYRPKYILKTTVTTRIFLFDIGADYRYISKLNKDALKVYPNDDRVAQKVLDLRFSYTFGTWTLHTHVKNLFNHNYTTVERQLMPIRHYVMSLSKAF